MWGFRKWLPLVAAITAFSRLGDYPASAEDKVLVPREPIDLLNDTESSCTRPGRMATATTEAGRSWRRLNVR
jgi:hypothetical protein